MIARLDYIFEKIEVFYFERRHAGASIVVRIGCRKTMVPFFRRELILLKLQKKLTSVDLGWNFVL